ncbi:MAG TPA: DUF1003 domain-containing protein [Geminicoccus sp.]|uniref:DUF1003 domain-containing protein n=1 Tax=Geminicoccus sp. TaxID=2024832 RepID=UPI002CF7998F|nr:DUF1003 domain-containing protein [Geminicoccus sp.]HWL72028.1 DUF1003 domain-containing protein [Geminicoccus sp.]
MVKSKEPPLRHPCQICGRVLPRRELTPLPLVREQVIALMQAEHPGIDQAGFVCRTDLDHYRAAHVRRLIQEQVGETAQFDELMLDRLSRRALIAEPVDAEIDRNVSFGQRLADRVASFGGSWFFIGMFALLLVLWMALNSYLLRQAAFDPYPYILLNLILSCLAAIQAPVIMMSQNRQEARDRKRAENDYLVNLKAELEVRLLHDKLDHLLHHQWERLMEIQDIQIEIMRARQDRSDKA